MKFFSKYRKPFATVLVIAMTALSVPVVPVQAGMVETDRVIQQSEDSSRDRVRSFLNRQDVRTQLESLGISPEEAQSRVAALSDSEIDRIVGRIDELPAGQGAGAIIGAAVLIFLILLITDLVGLTDVFGFTKKGSLNPS